MAILGLPRYYGRQIVAVIIVLLSMAYLLSKMAKSSKLDNWEIFSLIFLFVCFIVSFISNNYIYPQDVSGWVPALYLLTPIALIFALKAYRATAAGIIAGIVFAGASGAVIVVVDHFINLSVMDVYERAATVGLSDRRIVFLKTEAAIAASVIAARLILARGMKKRLINFLIAAPLFYSLLFISESRLAIAAVMIGTAIFALFVAKGKRKLKYIVIGLTVSVLFLPFALEKYVEQFKSSGYLEEDASVVFRLLEMEHFKEYFEKTGGLGFGVMSTGANKNNILAYSANKAGYDYGSGDYGMGLADIGIYAALYQFGWVGLILVLYMTLVAAIYMMRIARLDKNAFDVGAVGAITLAYMLSPLPMNFFTLDSTAIDGGLLWALCGLLARSRVIGSTPAQLRHRT